MVVCHSFATNVFVNCPFDEDYAPVLRAMLFCLIRLGLTPRIASERSDSGEPRVEKILELIACARFSIHDLSRCQAKQAGEHYRLNMPFELGIDFGCRRFGAEKLTKKAFLILEEESYRYQAAISDLAGCDIEAHGGSHEVAVRKLRNWIVQIDDFEQVGAAVILSEYRDFQEWNYDRQRTAGFSEEDILDYPTAELMRAMFEWVELYHPRT